MATVRKCVKQICRESKVEARGAIITVLLRQLVNLVQCSSMVEKLISRQPFLAECRFAEAVLRQPRGKATAGARPETVHGYGNLLSIECCRGKEIEPADVVIMKAEAEKIDSFSVV